MRKVTDIRLRLQKRYLPLLIGGAALGVGAAIPAGLAWYFLHPARRLHRATPRSAFGLPFDRIRFRAADGAILRGWFVAAPTDAGQTPRGMAVICHGYHGNRGKMLPYLKILHDAGYAALLFDFRAHGWSGGIRATFGLQEQDDLRAALGWVETQPEIRDLPLVVLGESMGASVALLVAATTPQIRAVIADSPFARFDAAMEARLQIAFGPVAPVITPPTRRIGERLLGVPLEAIAPEDIIASIAPSPILLIQGQEDRLVTPDNARRLQARSPENITLWEVADARHVRSIYVAREEYAHRVNEFLDAVSVIRPCP